MIVSDLVCVPKLWLIITVTVSFFDMQRAASFYSHSDLPASLPSTGRLLLPVVMQYVSFWSLKSHGTIQAVCYKKTRTHQASQTNFTAFGHSLLVMARLSPRSYAYARTKAAIKGALGEHFRYACLHPYNIRWEDSHSRYLQVWHLGCIKSRISSVILMLLWMRKSLVQLVLWMTFF